MNNDLPKLPLQLTALKGLKSYWLCAAFITDAEKSMGYTTCFDISGHIKK